MQLSILKEDNRNVQTERFRDKKKSQICQGPFGQKLACCRSVPNLILLIMALDNKKKAHGLSFYKTIEDPSISWRDEAKNKVEQ